MSADQQDTFWPTRHPLESLSGEEIQQVVNLLKTQTDRVTETTRFVSIDLREVDKTKIFNRAEDIVREVDVILFDNGTNMCYEARVSLADPPKVVSIEHIPGVQPTMTIDEQVECEQAVLRSEEFRRLVRENYGIDDINRVMIDIWSSGYYGAEEEKTKRLARPLCFVRSFPGDNGYTHPIEGLRPVVDLNTSLLIKCFSRELLI